MLFRDSNLGLSDFTACTFPEVLLCSFSLYKWIRQAIWKGMKAGKRKDCYFCTMCLCLKCTHLYSFILLPQQILGNGGFCEETNRHFVFEKTEAQRTQGLATAPHPIKRGCPDQSQAILLLALRPAVVLNFLNISSEC